MNYTSKYAADTSTITEAGEPIVMLNKNRPVESSYNAVAVAIWKLC